MRFTMSFRESCFRGIGRRKKTTVDCAKYCYFFHWNQYSYFRDYCEHLCTSRNLWFPRV